MNNNNTTPPPLPDLILSLEQATLMAKQLPSTTDPTHLLQIYSSLHHAHHHLSSFLSQNHQLPSFPLQPPPQENSLSSATGADENGDEPMQVGDDDEENSDMVVSIEKVEEGMRDCFIKNKRPKRRLSPSTVAVAVAEERRLYDDGFGGGIVGFDPRETRLRALDLIYQFHG